MRTTLTLDDDVVATLERVRRSRDANFKDVVNEALRRGLKEMSSRPKPREPFRTHTVDLGKPRIGTIDNIADVLAIAEGEAYK